MPTSAVARKRLPVWLALLAMWLIVVAPIASQLIVSARAAVPDANNTLCSATTSSAPAAAPHLHPDGLAACGYCTLLAYQPAMPAPPASPLLLIAVVTAVAAAIPTAQHVPAAAFPSGRPRAPPAFPTLHV